MSKYKVQATHDGATQSVTFDAADSMDATMHAIRVVLDAAMDDVVWERGHVTLTDKDGNVLHEMAAKG